MRVLDQGIDTSDTTGRLLFPMLGLMQGHSNRLFGRQKMGPLERWIAAWLTDGLALRAHPTDRICEPAARLRPAHMLGAFTEKLRHLLLDHPGIGTKPPQRHERGGTGCEQPAIEQRAGIVGCSQRGRAKPSPVICSAAAIRAARQRPAGAFARSKGSQDCVRRTEAGWRSPSPLPASAGRLFQCLID